MKKQRTFTEIEEFKKNTQFNEKLGLDDRDNIILSLVQKKHIKNGQHMNF